MLISPSFLLSSNIDQGEWGAFLNKNESEFVIDVIAVSPKPEFSQQFCPRLLIEMPTNEFEPALFFFLMIFIIVTILRFMVHVALTIENVS